MDRKSLPRGRVRKPYAAVRHWRIVAAPHLYQTVVPSAVTLLGFTFYWGLSRKKTWVVKQKTSKSSLSKALRRISIIEFVARGDGVDAPCISWY